MSFFDDDEETATQPATGGGSRRPRPRTPRRSGGEPPDHTLIVRRRIALAIAIVVLVVIVLVVNGCVSSERQSAMKEYDREVALIADESNSQVARPLFGELTNASKKTAIDVEGQVDQLRVKAQELASHAAGLSVPGEMESAQRSLLLAMNLREEGMSKIASLIGQALAGGAAAKHAITLISGDMELFLASDVLFSQRIVPYISETLAANDLTGPTITSKTFLPNIGWLEPSVATERITGQGSSTSSATEEGTHGSALLGVSVGANALEPEPTLNHVSGGTNPTFTVEVENDGSAAESEVRVNVAVTAEDKKFSASRTINSLQPESKVNVEIPVDGVPLGVGAKVEVEVQPVPGETETENNKGVYLAVFGK
ncbi:MAG TPA: hypothetical protein VMA83_08470 [Solirubrobacteraceae bacterium]|nr:hypothetical protein [Solirubrobacteraceae bacterium]